MLNIYAEFHAIVCYMIKKLFKIKVKFGAAIFELKFI